MPIDELGDTVAPKKRSKFEDAYKKAIATPTATPVPSPRATRTPTPSARGTPSPTPRPSALGGGGSTWWQGVLQGLSALALTGLPTGAGATAGNLGTALLGISPSSIPAREPEWVSQFGRTLGIEPASAGGLSWEERRRAEQAASQPYRPSPLSPGPHQEGMFGLTTQEIDALVLADYLDALELDMGGGGGDAWQGWGDGGWGGGGGGSTFRDAYEQYLSGVRWNII